MHESIDSEVKISQVCFSKSIFVQMFVFFVVVVVVVVVVVLSFLFFVFSYLGFLSRTFTIHKTAGEGTGFFLNTSVPLLPVLQILSH